ncbi:MAG: nucleoside hydrolase [Prevotella sp.]|nr:nucleoside hydrolase [Prevotella sp.]
MKHIFYLLSAALTVLAACSDSKQKEAENLNNERVNLILDTDLGPDYDDVGAMAVMHVLADSGQVNILAVMSSNHNEQVIPCIDVINTYYGRPDIPLGAPKSDGGVYDGDGHNPSWAQLLVEKYPHKALSTSDAEDAVKLYRRILGQAEDRSVVICTVGFFTNMRDLLQSEPDEFSELNGRQLVGKKVKRLVSMAGGFPEGREYNVWKDASASYEAINNWPTEIIFSGWEIGDPIRTGLKVSQTSGDQNPIKDVYAIALPQDNPEGRQSWDLTAVLVAIKGAAPFFGVERGTISVKEDGSNTWTEEENGRHYRLVETNAPEAIAEILDNYLLEAPQKK